MAAKVKLRPVDEQVMVITGASSGIGLVTARMAAARGARVVLTARNERALKRAVKEIEAAGGAAMYVVADVADEDAVERVAEEAVSEYGRIDTWVNNASTSIYGRAWEVPLADKRRLLDVNFWGVVHGCRSALPRLQERGGALINVGSVLSEQAIPMQGMYVAAKHAVKGYTDALRMEIEEQGLPVSVTLVKPASIDTPFFDHARNYMPEGDPKPAPPVYAPEVVAKAILRAAERPVRDVFAGGSAKAMAAMGHHAPRLTDRLMEKTQVSGQQKDGPPSGRPDNLYEPVDQDGVERGSYDGKVLERSAYTSAALRPVAGALAAIGLGLAVAAGVRALRGARRGDDASAREPEGDAGTARRGRGRSGTARRDAGTRASNGVADSAESMFHVPRA